MLINESGRHDEVSCFTVGAGTEAYGSCSTLWQNDFYIIGGKNEMKQISKLSGYALAVVGNLPFDHYFGSCNNVAGKIYLQKFPNERNYF